MYMYIISSIMVLVQSLHRRADIHSNTPAEASVARAAVLGSLTVPSILLGCSVDLVGALRIP